MPIDIYTEDGSPPCRAVAITKNLLGIKCNLKYIDMSKGEHLSPSYIKLNPQHTLPAIDDNGFVLSESRAIMCYLVNKYGKDDSLYPKDPQKRAVVDKMLYFDVGTYYARFADYYYVPFFSDEDFSPEKFKKIEDAFTVFNAFLANSEYAAGNSFTIADITLAVTTTCYEADNFDISKYSNVAKWLAKVKASPEFKKGDVDNHHEMFKKWLTDMLKTKRDK